SGDVARPRQPGDITPCQRIEIDGDYDDGNEAARAHDRLQRRFGPGGDDQIRLRAHQLRCDDEGATRIVQPPIVNGEVLTFAKAEVAQLRTERLILGDCRRIIEARPEEAEPNESAGLLRARRERPRRRAAEQRHERAALHSITSSARARSVAGTSSPSALAVLRLITNSYLVGACTGRSAGFSPRRVRST